MTQCAYYGSYVPKALRHQEPTMNYAVRDSNDYATNGSMGGRTSSIGSLVDEVASVLSNASFRRGNSLRRLFNRRKRTEVTNLS